MLARITQIIKIEHDSVLCKWNNGEERIINFAKVVESYPHHLKNLILDKKILTTIKLNKEAQTLYIPNLLDTMDGNLDFCPDILFSKSEFLSKRPQF